MSEVLLSTDQEYLPPGECSFCLSKIQDTSVFDLYTGVLFHIYVLFIQVFRRQQKQLPRPHGTEGQISVPHPSN